MMILDNHKALMSHFDEGTELRHLLNVDINEYDYDSEEFEFEPDEYNYIIYIAKPLQELLGQKLAALSAALESSETFERFLVSEEDLYGAWSSATHDQIVDLILSKVEELVC